MRKNSFFSPLERFFIARYLQEPKRFLLRFNFAFMVLGIVLSVGILGAGLNLFEGYERTLKSLLLDSMSHISIHAYNGEKLSQDRVDSIRQKLISKREVLSVHAMLGTSVMASKDDILRGCQIKAYEASSDELPFEKYVRKGSSKPLDGEVIIGHHLAKELGLSISDSLNIVYPRFDRISALGIYPGSINPRIVGIYQSGYYEFDRSIIICNVDTANELLLSPDQYSYLEIRLKNAYLESAGKLAGAWERELDSDLIAMPWTAFNSGLFRLIVLEKWLIFIIFSFLVLISGLNVVSAVTTVLYDKKAEIAILKTIGAPAGLIRRLLYLRIALVCVASIISGQLLGILLSWLVTKQRFYALKGDVYFIDRLVMHVSLQNQLIIFAAAALMIYICIMVPLKYIDKTEIIEVLRNR